MGHVSYAVVYAFKKLDRDAHDLPATKQAGDAYKRINQGRRKRSHATVPREVKEPHTRLWTKRTGKTS
jgi:hypothetical protein